MGGVWGRARGRALADDILRSATSGARRHRRHIEGAPGEAPGENAQGPPAGITPGVEGS